MFSEQFFDTPDRDPHSGRLRNRKSKLELKILGFYNQSPRNIAYYFNITHIQR